MLGVLMIKAKPKRKNGNKGQEETFGGDESVY